MTPSAACLLCVMFVLEVIGQTMFSKSIAGPEKPAESSSSLGRSALHKCWTYTTASIRIQRHRRMGSQSEETFGTSFADKAEKRVADLDDAVSLAGFFAIRILGR